MCVCVQARKLASLLKEAERGREALQGEVASRTLEAGSAEADMREILQHNARLQADSQEHEALKGSYNQLLCRSHTHARTHTCTVRDTITARERDTQKVGETHSR